MLQSVCSVIDHRWHQNMVRTSVIHSPKGFCHFFVLTTFWSRSWSKTENNAQQHGIYLLNIKTLTFPCLSTSPPLVLRNMTFLGCRICAILIAALLASTHSTWPDGHSPTAVKTGICPDLGGRGELKVSEWIKLLPEVYCPYVKDTVFQLNLYGFKLWLDNWVVFLDKTHCSRNDSLHPGVEIANRTFTATAVTYNGLAYFPAREGILLVVSYF